ncbi:transmembrane protein, putative (macronuclear) [Tetrahymena thermophila SB210]|uniref:Transmembrane protein, putative n=1 Tax=Tetrahymena thermophila (strain SB210) TaxID=312017 RepID=W7XBI7_TETTS|nr:transmembrane protein, putative [Tetrahymena thermophila SB210]EWS74702.1 transmembrane protein, putative [Tetrahymena thermophila SB210]|eukprot:XP_012652703.1 transmembrane protein, putative [Tetrahymena thermophila SB210]
MQNMILNMCLLMDKLIIVHKIWKRHILTLNKKYFYANIAINSKQYKLSNQKMVRSLAYVNHVIVNTFLIVLLIILNQGKVIGESHTLLIKMKLSLVRYNHKIALEVMSQRIIYVTKVTQDLNAQTVIQKDNIGVASILHMVTFPVPNVVISKKTLQKFLLQLYQFQ